MSFYLDDSPFCSTLLVDNNVQAPLVPSVLAAAIDLPLPSDMNESDDKSQSGSGRTLGPGSAGPSASSQRGKSNNPALNTAESQKKLGKFFKGLGPSKAPTLPMITIPTFFNFNQKHRIRTILYLAFIGHVQTLVHHSNVLQCA